MGDLETYFAEKPAAERARRRREKEEALRVAERGPQQKSKAAADALSMVQMGREAQTAFNAWAWPPPGGRQTLGKSPGHQADGKRDGRSGAADPGAR